MCRQLSRSKITPGRGHIVSFISISLEPASRTLASTEKSTGLDVHQHFWYKSKWTLTMLKISIGFSGKHFWLHSFYAQTLRAHLKTSTHLINHCHPPHLKGKAFLCSNNEAWCNIEVVLEVQKRIWHNSTHIIVICLPCQNLNCGHYGEFHLFLSVFKFYWVDCRQVTFARKTVPSCLI